MQNRPTQPLPKSRLTPGMTDRLVERFSDANRPFVAAGVRQRRNEGLRPGSIHAWVNALTKVDQFLEGKPFADATPDDLSGVIASLRESGLSDSTVHMTSVMMKRAWKELLDVYTLPRQFATALAVRQPQARNVARTLSEEEFHAMLQVAKDRPGRLHSLSHGIQGLALLWLLWDTGFRAQELLALNIGDVQVEDRWGAQITLRPDMPSLKTGPRSIYVSQCVGILRVHLQLHPWKDDPKAPLFPGFRLGKAGRMQYMALSRFVASVADESGVNADSSWARPVTPHTFRHACATRKARLGWNEAQLRAYFGWRHGSKMASHYVHLVASDLRDQVRKDAGVAADTAEDPSVDRLLEALRRLLAEGSSNAHAAGHTSDGVEPP